MPRQSKRTAEAASDVEQAPHLFDQTNGILEEDTSPDRGSAESDAERARGATLGAAMPAGWGR